MIPNILISERITMCPNESDNIVLLYLFDDQITISVTTRGYSINFGSEKNRYYF